MFIIKRDKKPNQKKKKRQKERYEGKRKKERKKEQERDNHNEMVKNKANSVVTEPSDVPFVACVEEDGPTIVIPKLVGHQVALLECLLIVKSKMIHLATVETDIILQG